MAALASDDDEPITGINITPLVDIILVLLIIFMMTASYIVSPAITVELPKAATGEPTVQTTLALVLTREGDLFLNNAKVTEPAVREHIREKRRQGAEVEAVIAADAAITHGRVVALIDLIKQEGIVKFALNTESEFSSANPPAPVSPSSVGPPETP